MGPGTLYGTLNRLVDEDLIVETTDRVDRTESERRRYDELTPTGRTVALAELDRLQNLLRRGQAWTVGRGDRMSRDPVAVRVYCAVTRLYPLSVPQ